MGRIQDADARIVVTADGGYRSRLVERCPGLIAAKFGYDLFMRIGLDEED